jgi:hypothetical protein
MKSLVFKNQNLKTNQIHKGKISAEKRINKAELVFEKVNGSPFLIPENPLSQAYSNN